MATLPLRATRCAEAPWLAPCAQRIRALKHVGDRAASAAASRRLPGARLEKAASANLPVCVLQQRPKPPWNCLLSEETFLAGPKKSANATSVVRPGEPHTLPMGASVRT